VSCKIGKQQAENSEFFNDFYPMRAAYLRGANTVTAALGNLILIMLDYNIRQLNGL
jgi:hypothetical protein